MSSSLSRSCRETYRVLARVDFIPEPIVPFTEPAYDEIVGVTSLDTMIVPSTLCKFSSENTTCGAFELALRVKPLIAYQVILNPDAECSKSKTTSFDPQF